MTEWPGLSAVVAFLALGPTAADVVPRLDVAASCERKASKGRVLCDVEFEIQEGRIAWADVVVVRAPPFARPLRSRVGVLDARSRTERRVHIPVAFVARDQGIGTVAFRGRAVVCSAGASHESCSPVAHEVAVELKVGPDER